MLDHLLTSSLFFGLAELFLCSFFLLLCLFYFGKCGIYSFAACAFIVANIQVLRTTNYFFQETPVALGNIAFISIFLANNILVEFYGVKYAKQSIYISFILYLFFTAMVFVTMLYQPKTDYFYQSFAQIFSNSPRLFLSGVVSYLFSQLFDIWILSFLKKIWSANSLIFLRNFLAVALCGMIDNIIFSVLAWKILAKNPVTTESLIFTYILGTYWFRIFGAVYSGFAIIAIRSFVKLKKLRQLKPEKNEVKNKRIAP